jgi:nitrite reductase (cytochrome c-552)
MSELNTRSPDRGARFKLWIAVAGVVGVVGAFGGAALLANIAEKKVQGTQAFYRVVELNDTIDDPAVWGKNFPLHYEDYMRTAEMRPTRFGGSEAVTRVPTAGDPRAFVPRSKIEKDPRRARMWSGFAFSADFREKRGHRWNFIDQAYTLRQLEFKQPGTCLNCHASNYVAMMKAGEGDLYKGFATLNQMTWDDAAQKINHPVTCIDCHNPQTMELRITRPALIEGMRALRASEGIQNYDVNQHASRQEMRSLVCAQCHVEYYFKGEERNLVFPWAKGLKADSMLAYYDEIGFRDWEHKLTGTNTLKAQHPEYELFMQGTHGKSGVTCADCHMPFKRVGGQKISDHHVRSPLLNVNRSCQTCHRTSEQELITRVEEIQERTYQMTGRAFNAVMALIDDIEKVKAAEGETERVKQARDFHRRAQWYVDYVDAENSTGFHAPQESARLLQMSVDYARQGQLVLSGGTTVSTTRINLQEMRNPPNKPGAPGGPPAAGVQR